MNQLNRIVYMLKGELHLKLKFSMFCALPQNYQHCFDNMHSEANCLRNSEMGIKILVGQAVLELLIKTIFLMFQLKTLEPSGMLKL